MNIHEYQAKALLAEYGVPTLRGKVAYTVQEAVDAAAELGSPVAVIKAQIHAGGRGKAGGVKVVKSLDEVKACAEKMLGKTLITHQTGPEGQQVRRLYIEQGCEIAHEFYLSFVVDRGSGMISAIASTEGGVDIEEVASKSPEKIIKATIDPVVGFGNYLGRKIAFGLGFEGSQIGQVTKMLQSLYEAFVDLDANLIEINPLVVNKEGSVFALDAKMTFDDNALYRHPQVEDLRDEDEEDPNEIQAKQYDLSYVKLDGNIGCMVNGAGLAMATMDIIKFYGAEPANFLDVGGGATKEKVSAAFKIILADPNVEAILINIFGGIMRCDVIAEGIVAAAKEVSLTVPMVVRLHGTKSEEGKKILQASGLDILSADGLADAAQQVVNAAKGAL